jgi:3-hydroxy-5-methyl-1-naphthoate 3-O-methyltransferase
MSESSRVQELEPDRVLHLIQAYQEPRVVLTACELDLFAILGDRPLTAESIAQTHGWDARALRVLLDALTVMGFVDKTLDKYSVSYVNQSLLSTTDARAIISAMRLAAKAWPAWSNLTAHITGGRPPPDRDAVAAQVEVRHATDERLAPGIAALVRPENGRRLLCVGDISGAYASAFLARDRSLQVSILVDSSVTQHTQRCLADAESNDRVELLSTDVVGDEWPGDQDLVFLSGVVHEYSEEFCERIYSKAFAALVGGGRVIVRDHIMSENRLRPRTGAMFNVHLLVTTQRGATQTYSTMRQGLEREGFVDIRLIQDGERMNGLVEAFKPR